MPHRSPTTESPLALPGPGRSLRTFGRALRLRRPHCGRGRVLVGWQHWGRVRERCGSCGLRFERGGPEYFSGSMLSNLFIAEMLFTIGFLAVLALTWPDVPWDALTYGAAIGMALAPVIMYPVSRVLWLAMDVSIRPVTPDELLPPPPSPDRAPEPGER